ncbi:hypothetical protein LZ554_005533 [Drepanopeziza brunnea f. sp. 'monogermtubi']|nr:hypothetical protein LZ554_005533 [Drepanopeziza brunnea f. sp. 'monogermtubi']
MPRQSRSGGGRAPARPTVPQRQVAPQQTRPATTSAAPPATQQAQPPVAPQQGSGAGGMISGIAQTAAGVAAGHAISNWMFGGSSAPAAEQAQQGAVANNTQASEQSSSWGPKACEGDVKQFTTCMNENKGNMQICGWYLEQLKACQQAASQY